MQFAMRDHRPLPVQKTARPEPERNAASTRPVHQRAGAPTLASFSILPLYGDSPKSHQKIAPADGLVGTAQSMPYRRIIQRSFGEHDIRHVTAHFGDAAARVNRAMRSTAYTSRDRVAFAGSPTLHTSAHEAAHVVQQRAGVEIPSGVGQPGDRYERDANAVADLVAAGRSAEPVLDRIVGSGRRSGGANAGEFVQMQGGIAHEPKGPQLGTYEFVAPYKDKQFVPYFQTAAYRRILALDDLRVRLAQQMTDDSYKYVFWRFGSPESHKTQVYSLIYRAVVLHDLGDTVEVGIRVPKSDEIVSLGGIDWNLDAAKDFVAEKVEDKAKELIRDWVLKNVFKVSEVVIERADIVLDILDLITGELGTGDVELTPDEVLANVINALRGQAERKAAALKRKQTSQDFNKSLWMVKPVEADALKVSPRR